MAEEAYLGSPDNPRTAAVVGYITMIGWLIAYFMLYRTGRNNFSAFHLRQSLMLHIIAFILNVLSLLSVWHWFPYQAVVILAVLLFILWLIGAFRAINGNDKPVPAVGKMAQEIFKGL